MNEQEFDQFLCRYFSQFWKLIELSFAEKNVILKNKEELESKHGQGIFRMRTKEEIQC